MLSFLLFPSFMQHRLMCSLSFMLVLDFMLVLFCDVMQLHVSSFFILACFQCFFLHVCISFLIISLFVSACLQLFFLTGLPPVCVSVHIISFLISLFMTTPDMCRSVVSFLYATVYPTALRRFFMQQYSRLCFFFSLCDNIADCASSFLCAAV